MEMNNFSQKLCVNLLIILIIAGLTPLYGITQQDIKTIIDFAESLIIIAEKKSINTDGICIDEYFLSVIEKGYTDLTKLLKKKGWTFEQIEELLYITGLIMSLKDAINEDFVIDMLNEEGITKKDIDVVLKNASKLSKYFIYPDMENMMEGIEDIEGFDDLEDFDDLGEMEDIEAYEDMEHFDDVEDIDTIDDMDDENVGPPEDMPPPH